MKNRRVLFTTIVLVLACLDLPNVFGVVPAPDGGYPGGNTAEGTNALHNWTSGQYNTAVGLNALYADTMGSRNTGLGVQTLRFNVTGGSNTAVGTNALFHNRNSYNTAVGDSALFNNTIGNQNTADGYQALYSNATGIGNTAIGSQALYRNTTHSNTAIGVSALFSNTSGVGNTAIGSYSLNDNIVGGDNTATGSSALQNNIGSLNTANGALALFHNTSGAANTAIGNYALGNSTGSNNTALGASAGNGVTTASNVICIGTPGFNVSNRCFIGNIYGVMAGFGTAVYINSSGQLGTSTSSQRFKDNIKPMGKASEAILALKPVTFHYKKNLDPEGIPQFGLVAEEVEKVNPDLVIRDKEGKPYTVRYDQVNAMLLNEFLKEHKTVQELKKEIAALTATLSEQTAQIAKVSAQVELSKASPQTVLNDQ
jgi:Chaperone of endosialidase